LKWFKHFSDSLDDPFIQSLLDKFGAKGYLAYFGLLEIISKENGNKLTGELQIDPAYLRRKLRISYGVMTRIFHHCDVAMKLSGNFQKDLWHFSVPKLLELKDNYTKDLQVSRNKPSLEEEEEEEKKYIKKKSPSNGQFKKPTEDEVKAYCNERKNHVNPKDFINHYETVGWMRGKNKIKNWKACVRTWEKNAEPKRKGDDWTWKN